MVMVLLIWGGDFEQTKPPTGYTKLWAESTPTISFLSSCFQPLPIINCVCLGWWPTLKTPQKGLVYKQILYLYPSVKAKGLPACSF